MEPLLKTEAGEGLALWHPEFAAERRRWEVAAYGILVAKGFRQVVTPHLFKKCLLEEFADWFEPNPYRFADDEKRKECQDYVILGSKHLPHVQIFKNRPYSYRELPFRLFEIAESYDDVPIRNILTVYMTTFCEPKDEEREDDLMDEALNAISHLSPHIHCHSGEYHRGERDIPYIAADNSKKPIFVLMANHNFVGVPDG